ncbi:hypothetical protein F4677DRAFT_298266 [Hypoxylon crocopeplum]|nr:hypothetical protein F4677DRAFT_298266 [Hypoxylon crocopeplum]
MRLLTMAASITVSAPLVLAIGEVLRYNMCSCSIDPLTCADQGHGTYQIPNGDEGGCYSLSGGGGANTAYVLNTAECTLYSESGCTGNQIQYVGDNSGATYVCHEIPFGVALSAQCTRL